MTATEHIPLRFSLNGEAVQVWVDPARTLLEVLRESLALTGTKHGCELGECGACTVLLEGEPVLSCLLLAAECDGAVVDTVEGLADGNGLHPLQQAIAEHGGAQCGYCTPGMLMAASALLERRTDPSRAEIREALSGNLCRCTGYQQIIEAVEAAATTISRATAGPAGSGS